MHTLGSEFRLKRVIMCDDTRPTLTMHFILNPIYLAQRLDGQEHNKIFIECVRVLVLSCEKYCSQINAK